MMLGARTGAWAKRGGGVPTARDYVQDGLIAIWDGIENAEWGVHDQNATVWKDCVNGELMTKILGDGGLVSFGNMSVDVSLGYLIPQNKIQIINAINTGRCTVECVCKSTNFGKTGSRQSIANFNSSYNRKLCIYTPENRRVNWTIFWGQDNYLAIEKSRTEKGLFSIVCQSGSIGLFYNSQHVGTLLETVGGAKECFFGKSIEGIETSTSMSWNSIRIYNRAITSDEIAANYAIDKARFGIQ